MAINGSVSAASQLYGTRRLMGDARLMGQTSTWVTDPLDDWQREGRTAAAFAMNLVQTDAYCCALLLAEIQLTHGASGLRFRSHYQADDSTQVTDAELQARDAINRVTARSHRGTWFDASRLLTRVQFERQIDAMAIVTGDGFAVRQFKPGRNRAPYATCWRILDPFRVKNPGGVEWASPPEDYDGDRAPAGERIWNGIGLDDDDQPAALWIEMPQRDGSRKVRWMRVAWFSDDGVQNVIHRFDSLRPGQIRGFSAYLPIFTTARHLQGTSEAHVVAKRAQACHPLMYRSSDERVAAAFQQANAMLGPHTRMGPGQTVFLGADGELDLPSWQYQGDDFSKHVESQVRAMSAARGLPWQFVLAQLTNANLASSRAAMDQAERRAETRQNDHIAQVSEILDESIIVEAIARRQLGNVVSRQRAIEGDYTRPRGWITDRLKEANADKIDLELGISPSRIHERRGLDFRAEIRRAEQDHAYAEKHGIDVGTLPNAGQPAPEDTPPEPDDEPVNGKAPDNDAA